MAKVQLTKRDDRTRRERGLARPSREQRRRSDMDRLNVRLGDRGAQLQTFSKKDHNVRKGDMVVFELSKLTAFSVVTKEAVEEALRTGMRTPPIGSMIPMVDRLGRRVQEDSTTIHVYSGSHLVHAQKRAERWMRKNGSRFGLAPRHIRLAAAASGIVQEGVPLARAA